jgi:hypothetical protein
VVAPDRLCEEPVQLRRPDATGDGGDLGVDPPRGFTGEPRRRMDGRLSDGAGAPRRDSPRLHLRPQAGESVPQLEGVADELLRRRRRDPEDRTELGDAELRHQRAPVAGDRLLVLRTGHREGGRGVDRLGRVEVGPAGCESELVGGGAVLIGSALAQR